MTFDPKATITKRIISGASFGGTTTACGTAEFALRAGFLACGTGDDHFLSTKEKDLIKAGRTELPEGKLRTTRNRDTVYD